ncbi:OmpA family protein [Pseudoprimorskyibacter insulae]|uniref:Outer membrane lipoprotein Omp16 n=1 Tax=Pseudoprimorskyibacter insulae TaxID=1695997 RepID=A0A2R8AYN1_9RHOB|nr:OmpA family protein [Pseudoprimorskyibacter insulae]SPF80964.1 Outer membrane lipoprotein Omp16 [Pseudoprimorskyibacter insulae]
MFKPVSVSLASLALIGACTSADPVYTQFGREAGAIVDTGEFGNATMNNTMLMTGELQATSDLAGRFANEVNSTVTFAFNSAQLDSNARAVLSQQASWIRQFPEVRFRVYGHTDLVGSASYNYQLGLRRANAVVNYLATQGISRNRLEALVSYGETQPLIVTQGRERRNRRTVTEVSGFVKGHPSLLDGNYAQVVYREYVLSAQPRTTLSGAGTAGAQPGG